MIVTFGENREGLRLSATSKSGEKTGFAGKGEPKKEIPDSIYYENFKIQTVSPEKVLPDILFLPLDKHTKYSINVYSEKGTNKLLKEAKEKRKGNSFKLIFFRKRKKKGAPAVSTATGTLKSGKDQTWVVEVLSNGKTKIIESN